MSLPDPTEFTEEKDSVRYHWCGAILHDHHIPVGFVNCYEDGCWTWESKYSWSAVKDKHG